jgi:hypothetical protein
MQGEYNVKQHLKFAGNIQDQVKLMAHWIIMAVHETFQNKLQILPKITIYRYTRSDGEDHKISDHTGKRNISVHKFKAVTHLWFVKRRSVFAKSTTLNVIVKQTT